MKKGSVVDKKFNIVFQHAFTRTNGKVEIATLLNEYDGVKNKYIYLANKMLSTMMNYDDILYIAFGSKENEVLKIHDAISSVNNSRRFHVLGVIAGDETSGYIHLGKSMSLYTMNRNVHKPPHHKWQGDDQEWSKLLSAIDATWPQAGL